LATDGVLLERQRELGEVDAALRAAAAGRGGALAIEGEAGSGKTRLLMAARAGARDADLDVLSGRGTELEREFPFAVLRQLLERQLRSLSAADREDLFAGAEAARGALGIDAGAGDSPDPFSVLHALYWVLAGLAERRPLLLAVDDAHLADTVSLESLTFILPRLEELPVLLVLTCRTGEATDPALVRLLGDPAVEHLAPAPLSAGATTELVEGLLDRGLDPSFAAACHEVTGGNPFLVTELARELGERAVEPVASQVDSVRNLAPERVSQMVLARIARLPAEAMELARAVAIFGDDGDWPLTLELAGLDPEAGRRAADALRRAAILDPGQSLRFVHPLVRNAVYADFPAGQQATAHAAAAALLRERGAPPERVALQHLVGERRGDSAATASLLAAGRRSLADGAPRSAVTYLTRALHEPPPPDSRLEVMTELLAAGVRAADQDALAAVESELRVAIEHDPAGTRDVAIQLPLGMVLRGRFEEAAKLLESSVLAAAEEGDVESAFKLDAQLRMIGMAFPAAPAVDLQRYLGEIEPDSPAGRLAAAIEARSAVMNGSRHEAVEAAKRALGNGCSLFEEEPEMVSAMASVLILMISEEMEEARRAAERALEIARERNSAPEITRAWLLRGIVDWGAGDLVASESDLRQARELARLAGILPLGLLCAGSLALVLVERDELESAEAILEESGVAVGPIPFSGLTMGLLLVRGVVRFERGQFVEAAEDLTALYDESEKQGFGPGLALNGSVQAVRALVATGDEERARELAKLSLFNARRWQAPASVSLLLRAVAAAAGGAREIELLEEAVAVSSGSPWRLRHAYALVDLGTALRRQNQRAAARSPLRAGLKLARQCGAVRLAKRAHQELRATGETVRRYAPIGVESLTPSERRVAELAAAGMTNRQIAQSLFVTLKTVEAHLSAAYDKLDIGSRQQLAAALLSPRERP